MNTYEIRITNTEDSSDFVTETIEAEDIDTAQALLQQER